MQTYIEIEGARENNLRNLRLHLPHHSLIVITGVSGSGKSSLAYDTLFQEGQRRFLESLSPYARQFLGEMSKPNVDRITGLSPTLCIDQKRHGFTSRSTVGTITEIYDHLRLLFARLGTPYCPNCHIPVITQSADQIASLIMQTYNNEAILLLAPMVMERKGEYRKELAQWLSDGFLRVRINKKIYRLDETISLERYEKHTIELVMDRIDVEPGCRSRLIQGIEDAVLLSEGLVAISTEDDRHQVFSVHRTCPKCGFSIPELEPRLFSFNNNQGWCPHCRGQGVLENFDPALIVPDTNLSIREGAIAAIRKETGKIIFSEFGMEEIESMAKSYRVSLDKPWKKLPEKFRNRVLWGTETAPMHTHLTEDNLNGEDQNGAALTYPEKQAEDQTTKARILPSKKQQADNSTENRESKVRLLEQAKDNDNAEDRENKVRVLTETTAPSDTNDLQDDDTEPAADYPAKDNHTETEPVVIKVPYNFRGVIPELQKIYDRWHVPHCHRFIAVSVCPSCQGKRLRRESCHVLFREKSISDLSEMTIENLLQFTQQLHLDEREQIIGREIFHELDRRLHFLMNVGLSYLTLERHADSLAGGELQRIRLARQLGAGLQGVLYILDEPSIGLHPRDNGRLLQTLTQLRDIGNTMVVIEHDEETMRAADYIVDIGPGAGIHGGKIMAEGNISEVVKTKNSITSQYLNHQKQIEMPRQRRQPNGKNLVIYGAKAHNLKNLTVSIPLGLFTIVTGVSGSGKSTLINDILYNALMREWHDSSEIPGAHDRIEGMEYLDKVIEVDQSPIGRTSRSNPATYIKVMDHIRDLFAQLPESKVRGYTPGRFSFNVKGGRCEHCDGAGYEEVEMEFLANVLIPCEECNGNRFNRETLEITYKGKNIAQVLDMTAEECCEFFANHPTILHPMQMLCDVGMDYIKLGQPSPTLSGGESQRIKLVRELCKNSTGKTLYILDEPTTGLHFADIHKLLYALQRLVDQGNTILVIEHNLDVIKCADWIIDLGPEGGDHGGELLVAGPPETVMACSRSYTGQALSDYLGHRFHTYSPAQPYAEEKQLVLRGATKHNLKNISVTIPKNQLTVVTGVSGSGKSTLVFDTIFAEGQRRFLESLSTYARRFLGRMEHGQVDEIYGLAPSIAIDQKSISNNPRSTVATMTEIYDYLRILYARTGLAHCPHCHKLLTPYSPSSAAREIVSRASGEEGMLLAPLYIPSGKKTLALKSLPELREYSKKLIHAGFTRVLVQGKMYELDNLPKDLGKRAPANLVIDRFQVSQANLSRIAESLQTAFQWGRQIAIFYSPGSKIPLYFCEVAACVPCEYYQLQDLQPRHFSFNHYLGACPRCKGLGVLEDDMSSICPECHGDRLKPEFLSVTVGNLSIIELCQMRIDQALTFIQKLQLPKNQALIAKDLIREIQNRLTFLQDVGLEYLTLDRRGSTLSGGEAQRIRLATQIGNQLVGVLYVLDEPTIGLHQRDTERLLVTLRKLVALGNTILMVEHDGQCMKAADHILEMGPGPGAQGGSIVSQGTPQEIMAKPQSLTGRYLAGTLTLSKPRTLPEPTTFIKISNASLHNLQHINVEIPVDRLVTVAGVSGSGKSSLVVDILQKATVLFQRNRNKLTDLKRKKTLPLEGDKELGFGKITGLEHFDRFVVIDQSPIMRTPSSNPATYCDLFTPIRQLYASLAGSKVRGFTLSRFSFNITGGRCEVCEGRGLLQVEMHFLSDVWVTCHACQGKRFSEETLAVRYHDKNIAQVLDMDINQAMDFFQAHARILKKLKILQDIGLGYMKLGQPVNTLSGGESQRLKLASELCQSEAGRTLYIMDEPTTGLHAVDVIKLLDVLRQLLQQGHSVIVIEHNLDVIRAADWVMELGPQAGDQGGKLIYSGPPSGLLTCPFSATGQVLAANQRR